MSMSAGLSPGYCASCNSHYCSHAIQITEHNMRMIQDRMTNATSLFDSFKLMQGAVTRITGISSQIAVPATGGTPSSRKKLLLLRRTT